LLDDWLESVDHACQWNYWTPGEKVFQLASHLKGRAWHLIEPRAKKSYEEAG